MTPLHGGAANGLKSMADPHRVDGCWYQLGPYPRHDDFVVGVMYVYMHPQPGGCREVIIDLVVKDLHLVIT